jgi:thioredoxin reductase
MITSTQTTEVLVIGAGPYGLSAVAHLVGAGVETRVCGMPMDAWRNNMPRGMYLKSTTGASSLSAPGRGWQLTDYCAEAGVPVPDDTHPIPIDLFHDYGVSFQQKYAPNVERTEVNRVEPAGEGFRVALANGDNLLAKAVVVASGHVCFSYVPDELRASKRGPETAAAPISHASRHSDFADLSGRTIAVIGAGQSALETAVLAREAGAEVHLLVRGRTILWGATPVPHHSLHGLVKPASPLGPGWSFVVFCRAPELISYLPPQARLYLVRNILGPSGAWWLKRRFDRKINVMLGTIVEGAQISASRVSLQLRSLSGAASKLDVDHVVAATGYKVDVGSIPFLAPSLKAQTVRVAGAGAPRLSRTFESSVPGLYYSGLSAAATFGPLLRFVCGSEFTARRISGAIASPARPRSHPHSRSARMRPQGPLSPHEQG